MNGIEPSFSTTSRKIWCSISSGTEVVHPSDWPISAVVTGASEKSYHDQCDSLPVQSMSTVTSKHPSVCGDVIPLRFCLRETGLPSRISFSSHPVIVFTSMSFFMNLIAS